MFLGMPGLGIGRMMRFGGGFSPASNPGLALWLDPSDSSSVTLDTGKVSQVADKSGNSRHFSQATAANRPTIASAAINGLDTLAHAAGTAQYLEGPSLSALSEGEAFIVVQLDPGYDSGSALGLWHFGSPGDSGYFPFSDGTVYDSFGSTTRRTVGDPAPTLTSPRCFSVISTASEFTASLDGAELFTDPTNTVGWDTVSYIGRNGTIGNGLVGKIAEVIVYGQRLTATERNRVKAYLNAKWGLSIALSASTFEANIVGYGHSIVAGANATSVGTNDFFPLIRSALEPEVYRLRYEGHGGFATTSMLPLAADDVDAYLVPSKYNVFMYMETINSVNFYMDLGQTASVAATNAIADHRTMYEGRRAAGFESIIAYTLYPMQWWDPDHVSCCTLINQGIRAMLADETVDAIIDVEADPDFASPISDTIVDSVDLTHPTNLGHQLIADLSMPVVRQVCEAAGAPP